MRQIADKILEQMKLKLIISLSEKGKTLDIGCGDQRFTKYLDNAIGIDVSRWNFTHIKAFRNMVDVIALGENLPFKDGSFNSVHAHDVLEHISNIKQARDEIYRVLEEKGFLVQADPNDFRLFLARLLSGNVRQAFHHGLYGRGSGHVHNFNSKMLKEMFDGKFVLEKSRKWLVFDVYKWRKISDEKNN